MVAVTLGVQMPGRYSKIVEAGAVGDSETIEALVLQVLAEIRSLSVRLDAVESRKAAERGRGPVTDADVVPGVVFWTRTTGGSDVVQMRVRPGSENWEGDGDVAYRMEHLDRRVLTGKGPTRKPRELHWTKAEADASPPRLRGDRRPATGKRPPADDDD